MSYDILGHPIRVRALLIEQLKVNNRPLCTHLYYTKCTSFELFCKEDGKT